MRGHAWATQADVMETTRQPLRRSHTDRMLSGTAAGIAHYLNIDPTLVRVGFAVLTVMGGAGIPLYLAGLLLIPEENSDESIASDLLSSFQRKENQS
jgi:phage shock protein C